VLPAQLACCRASSAGKRVAWASLDHFVGGNEQFVGDGEAEHPGSLVIDDQFQLGRLQDRQVRRLGSAARTAAAARVSGTGGSRGARACVTPWAWRPGVVGRARDRSMSAINSGARTFLTEIGELRMVTAH
jgi:hypothetical protein